MSSRNEREEVEALFPGLAADSYDVTSRYEPRYNCLAHVAGDKRHWWEPTRRGGYFWPAHLPLEDYSQANYVACVKHLGFEECVDGSFEADVEKVGVYFDQDGEFFHIAVQRGQRWSSKLGGYEDIAHRTLESLLRGRPEPFGEELMFFSRPKPVGSRPSGLIVPGGRGHNVGTSQGS